MLESSSMFSSENYSMAGLSCVCHTFFQQKESGIRFNKFHYRAKKLLSYDFGCAAKPVLLSKPPFKRFWINCLELSVTAFVDCNNSQLIVYFQAESFDNYGFLREDVEGREFHHFCFVTILPRKNFYILFCFYYKVMHEKNGKFFW